MLIFFFAEESDSDADDEEQEEEEEEEEDETPPIPLTGAGVGAGAATPAKVKKPGATLISVLASLEVKLLDFGTIGHAFGPARAMHRNSQFL